MRMAIDQARQYRVLAQNDHGDVARRRRLDGIERPDLPDLAAIDPDSLIRAICSRPHVEQATGPHERRLRDGLLCPDRKRGCEGENKESEDPAAHARSVRRWIGAAPARTVAQAFSRLLKTRGLRLRNAEWD